MIHHNHNAGTTVAGESEATPAAAARVSHPIRANTAATQGPTIAATPPATRATRAARFTSVSPPPAATGKPTRHAVGGGKHCAQVCAGATNPSRAADGVASGLARAPATVAAETAIGAGARSRRGTAPTAAQRGNCAER